MLCLLSSANSDRNDGDVRSHRLPKRKADSESEGEEFAETPVLSYRSPKRASAEEELENVAWDRSRSVFEKDYATLDHWYNNPSDQTYLSNESGQANVASRDPLVQEGLSRNSATYDLYSSSNPKPTLASLLGQSEPALFPCTLEERTRFSSSINPRRCQDSASLGATSDHFCTDNFSSSMPAHGRDFLLARQRSPHQYNSSISSPSGQRSPHQYNSSISSPSGISRSAESSPVPTLGSRFDSRKVIARRPSLSYEESVSHAQDILNRQRYAGSISACRSSQEPRTLPNPTTANSFHHHRASTATAMLGSWTPPRSSSSMSANPTLADLLSSRRRSSLTATASTTPNYSILGDVSPSRRFSLPPRLFPSEQQSALDNALVFSGQQLSHHLSSYPSAASAQSSSWPSVAMEVEALAASFAQREFAARQSLGTGIPTNLPVSLSLPEDSQVLSELQVYIRQQIEVFRASEEDTLTHKRGRNKPITVGQVGIRCRHCAHLPIRHRQVGSTYFPSSLMGIYQVAQNMAKFHLQTGVCSEIPVNTQRHVDALISVKKASVTSGVGRRYWAESAKSIGLVDTEESGIRFIRDL